jgi:hypothetical protein
VVVKNGNCKVQEIDQGAEVSKNPSEFTITHGVLEGCPVILMGFDVGVSRQGPGSKSVIKVATVKRQEFAERGDSCQFGNSKVESGVHGHWWGTQHGCTLELFPDSIAKFEDNVVHNDLECLDDTGRLHGKSTAKERGMQKEGNSAQGMISVDVGVHQFAVTGKDTTSREVQGGW